MSYSNLLNDMIKENNLSFKELSEKCKQLGRNIDPSYISKLVNGKIPPPSDEVSAILSKACGKNEEILILEAYLDKAPQVFKNFLDKIKIYFKTSTDNFGIVNSENYEIINKILKDEPISKFILEFNENSNNRFVGGIEINDDSMEPLIKKGSEILLSSVIEIYHSIPIEESYSDEIVSEYPSNEENTDMEHENDDMTFINIENGDVLAVWDLLANEFQVRKFYNIEDTDKYILAPINNKYRVKIYDFQNTFYDLVTINRNSINIDDQKLNTTRDELIQRRSRNIYDDIQGVNIIGKVEKIINKL